MKAFSLPDIDVLDIAKYAALDQHLDPAVDEQEATHVADRQNDGWRDCRRRFHHGTDILDRRCQRFLDEEVDAALKQGQRDVRVQCRVGGHQRRLNLSLREIRDVPDHPLHLVEPGQGRSPFHARIDQNVRAPSQISQGRQMALAGDGAAADDGQPRKGPCTASAHCQCPSA